MTEIRLSGEQLGVVEAEDPAIVLVAGAGSGKTEVVAQRLERVLTESAEDEFRVLAITYTVKAAQELRSRLDDRLGALSQRVDAETFHGFAHRMLREHGTRIGLPVEPELLVRDDDRVELLERWLQGRAEARPMESRELLGSIDLARAKLEDSGWADEWRQALDESKALDYPALLERATELLQLKSTRRQLVRLYGAIVVDEAQNMTPAQYQLLSALVADSDGDLGVPTMVVGDEKQSIVSFAGADPALIGRFEKDYLARRFELSCNFRSARAIVSLSNAVSQALGAGPASASDGQDYAAPGFIRSVTLDNEQAEAEVISAWVSQLLRDGLPEDALAIGEGRSVQPSEIAVLARAGTGLRRIDEALQQTGHATAVASAPNEWLGTPLGLLVMELVAHNAAPEHLSTRWALAKLLGCDEEDVATTDGLRLVLQRSDDPRVSSLAAVVGLASPAGLEDVLNLVPPPDTGASEEQVTQEAADWEADVCQLEGGLQRFIESVPMSDQTWSGLRFFLSRLQRGDDLDPGVRLLTVHKAQGREFRAVAICGCNDGQFPDFRASSAEQSLAELRTFYVAVTRPTRVLLLTRARSRATRYGQRATEPSPFLRYVARAEDGL